MTLLTNRSKFSRDKKIAMPIFHLLYSTQIYKSTFFGKIYCCHCVNSGTFQSLLYFGAGGIITETILVLQPLGAGLQGEGLHYPGVILAPLLEHTWDYGCYNPSVLGSRERACTILGSFLLPSLNSSRVSLSSCKIICSLADFSTNQNALNF